MAIRITADFARTATNGNHTTDNTLVLTGLNTSVGKSKVSIPGKIKPNFKLEGKAGLTNRDVFGEISTENILDVSAGKLMRGEFNGRIKLSDEISLSFSGTESLGGLALTHMLLACRDSADEVANDWSNRVIRNAIETEDEENRAKAKAKAKAEKSEKATANA